jgi:large subunit ribosomal protein L35
VNTDPVAADFDLGYTDPSLKREGDPCLTGQAPERADKTGPIWRTKEKTMPKLKTHTGAAKRFSKTGTGKIKRGQTKTRHILTSKGPKTKRKLGKTVLVSDGDYKKVARMIPYA